MSVVFMAVNAVGALLYEEVYARTLVEYGRHQSWDVEHLFQHNNSRSRKRSNNCYRPMKQVSETSSVSQYG